MRARITAAFAIFAILGMLLGGTRPAHAQGTATVSNLHETWHTTILGVSGIFDQTEFTFAWNVPYPHIPSWTFYVHVVWIDHSKGDKTDTIDASYTQRGLSYGIDSIDFTVSARPYTGSTGSGGGFLDNTFPSADMNSYDDVEVYWHYKVKAFIDGVYTGSSVTSPDSTHYNWSINNGEPWVGLVYN